VTRASLLYLASFAVHGGLAAGIVSLREPHRAEEVAVTVFEPAPPKAKPVEAPPPSAPEPAVPEQAAAPAPAPAARTTLAKSVAPAPAPRAAPDVPAPTSNDVPAGDAPDFGLALAGATAGGGLAVASRGGGGGGASGKPVQSARKLLAAAPERSDECAEPTKKPRVLTITQPAYTAEARSANVAGRVRVEVTVDASGRVAAARVLEGLGHGLDEAALASARAATFEAATRCGTATSATFVIAIRFAL